MNLDRRTERARLPVRGLLILASVLLLVLSVHRAATVPFNHDESVSFGIFTWHPGWRASANHHVLNTALMHLSSVLFGDSELSLRLPNLMAHAVYLLCSLALVTRRSQPALWLAGFVLLNFNLSLSEFWFVARGYGLALGLQVASLYFLVLALERWPERPVTRDILWAGAAGSLAVLANFSFLNYFLPLFLVSVGLLLGEGVRRREGRALAAAVMSMVAGGLFLALVLRRLFRLQQHGQLYLGGLEGFLSDTVGTLVRCSLGPTLQSAVLVRIISVVLIVLGTGLLLAGIRQLVSRRGPTVLGVLALVLAMTVALPILEHHLAGVPYPVHRTALYYIPLYGITLLYGLRAAAASGPRGARAVALGVAVGTALLAGQFAHDYHARSSCAWWEDSHNREVLAVIDRDHRAEPSRLVTLRASWVLEPSLNYYRLSRKYVWLAPVTREPVTRNGADYIYAYQRDLDSLPASEDSTLARYQDIGTVLLRVSHPTAP